MYQPALANNIVDYAKHTTMILKATQHIRSYIKFIMPM